MIEAILTFLLFPFYICGLCGAWYLKNFQGKSWLYSGMMNYPENPKINEIYGE